MNETTRTVNGLKLNRVVVTGFGLVTPLGITIDDNWNKLAEGKSGIGTISLFDTSDFTVKIAGEVEAYDLNPYVEKKEQRKMDRFIHFGITAGKKALEHSKLDMSREVPERVGMCLGTGIGGFTMIEENYNIMNKRGPRRISPFFIPGVLTNLLGGYFSLDAGCKGPNLCMSTACATGGHAIGEASRYIQRGDADVMIAGAAEGAITKLSIGGFAAMRALSTRNDDPQRASRPFDKGRDGFVMSEGSGVLILERLEHALQRGATIHAEVTGYGASGDAHHITQPSPEGEGAQRSMKGALKEAGVDKQQIAHINTHGTSTPVGDIQEAQAIRAVFGDHAKDISINSTKSIVGHLLGAAGAVEAIYTILAMKHGLVPPTINLEDPDEGCRGLDLTPNKAVKKDIPCAMSNSFGFGGTNACLIFSRYSQ